jgi:hypothetical protein
MVHVRPLPRTLLENDLRSQLESFGKIASCCILEEDSGGPVCSAFIEFESEQAVKQTLANDGKSNIRLTTPSGSTPAQIIPMNGVMRNITNWTSQKGGGGLFLNSTPPTISWDDSVLIARLPPKVGQLELKDFISSTISRHLGLEQTGLTGSGNSIGNQVSERIDSKLNPCPSSYPAPYL